jgi:hypothetical protein
MISPREQATRCRLQRDRRHLSAYQRHLLPLRAQR